MIYLDNGATSFPKPDSVIRATNECIKKYCANPGRSSHRLSVKISEKVYDTREAVANLLGVNDVERVVFTQNATHALNLAIKTTVKENSHVIISDMEHNSVFRPVYSLLEKRGVTYSIFNSSGDVEQNISELIRENSTCIISTLTSNVIGRDIPLSALSITAKKHGLKLIVDASQKIGHGRIDLKKTPCDILCAPSHKGLFGIQGSGFSIILDDELRETFIEGGSGSDSKNPLMPEYLPERFEAGTLPSPSIVSLLAGINYINSVGIDNINERLYCLSERYADVLSSVKNCVLYTHGNGIISFNVSGVPAEIIAKELDRENIFVRAGLHCAPLAHRSIGTLNIGTVRISLSYLNTEKEADLFYKAVRSICKKY